MAPSQLQRCPECGVLNAPEQTMCLRCMAPLSPLVSQPAALDAVTGETGTLYRARAGDATLFLARTFLEYSGPAVAFSTNWNNVQAIIRRDGDHFLQLFVTPALTRMPLGAGRAWFSDVTTLIPLRPFGFPLNANLQADLARFAPQLRRFLER